MALKPKAEFILTARNALQSADAIGKFADRIGIPAASYGSVTNSPSAIKFNGLLKASEIMIKCKENKLFRSLTTPK